MALPSADSPLPFGGMDVELDRRMPMAVYHAVESWHPERIGAMALYCSDGRWGEAFDEFCHRHLQIPRYDRWAPRNDYGPNASSRHHVRATTFFATFTA